MDLDHGYLTRHPWLTEPHKASATAAADDRADQKKQHEQSVKVRVMEGDLGGGKVL